MFPGASCKKIAGSDPKIREFDQSILAKKNVFRLDVTVKNLVQFRVAVCTSKRFSKSMIKRNDQIARYNYNSQKRNETVSLAS